MSNNETRLHSVLILLWNANGVIQHKNELELVLNDRRIDVALLCETHLTSKHKFSLPNYKIYRSDHPDGFPHGGTAIAIRSKISHHLLPVEQSNFMQVTAIHLECKPLSFSLASVYCPPRFAITTHNFTSLFQSLGPTFIAGGDFNAKHVQWGSRLNNPKGRNLHNCIATQNYSFISPSGFTYWPSSLNKQPDLLDFFVTSQNINTFSKIEFVDELSSDHSSILLSLSSSPIYIPPKPSLIQGQMDWDNFKNKVSNGINLHLPLKSESDIEEAVEHFVKTIQQAAWSSSIARPKPNNPHLPCYPSYIRDLIAEKRRVRKTWQLSRRLTDKTRYNRLNNELKRRIAEFKTNAFDYHIASLNTDDRSLWDKTKRILNYHSPSLPLRHTDGTWVVSDKGKANEFANHLSTVFCPHPDIINPDHSKLVDQAVSAPLPLDLPPKYFTPSDIKNQINRLPKRKSPGYDLITAEVLQQLPKKGLIMLTYIFNAILRTTKFPLQWKFSIIKMILKSGKPPNNPSSYRPISLLPLCSKLFERLLLRRITPFVRNALIIPDHQFGFREGHSTVHQLHRVVDYLATALESKQYAAGVFFDVSQAFDRVWLDGLLYKLKFLPTTYYLILQSFLLGRFFAVSQGTAQSESFPLFAGVPQGSVLAPLLYNIYTADIPTDPETLLASFADDTVVLNSDSNANDVTLNLQNHIFKLQQWFTDWRIKINSTKTTHVTFTLRKNTCPSLYLYGSPLPQTDKVRYLGLHIDRRLTWNSHIDLKRKMLETRRKQLFTLLSRRSRLPVHSKLLLYKSLLRPVWTYGCQVFGSAKPSVIMKLQRFQSKCIRIIADAPFYVTNETLHNDLRIPYVNDVIHHLYRRFKQKLPGNDNQLIQNLDSPNLPGNPLRRLRRRWSRDL